MRIILIILLAGVTLGLFVFGYYLMGKTDRFLYDNKKQIFKNSHSSISYVCTVPIENISEKELAKRIEAFKKEHPTGCVVMRDDFFEHL